MLKKRSIWYILSFMLIISCEKSKPRKISQKCTFSNTNTENVTINYLNSCTLQDACELKFCTDALQTPTQFTITSIITTQDTPALLQTSVGAVNTSSFEANSTLACTIDTITSTATCVNFAPLADHFTIIGTIGDLIVNLNVNIDTSGIKPAATEDVDVCGRFGVASNMPNHYTTEQRIYDCSKRVTHFAGLGNGNGTATTFVPGNPQNPSPNWFLVSCFDTQKEHCSWLTPVVPSSIATTTANEYLSTVNGTQGNLTSTLVGKRFLWSGVLTNTNYTFFEANGRNPWTPVSPAIYDFYNYANTSNAANIAVRGAGAANQICAPGIAGCTTTNQISSFTSGAYNSSTNVTTSICERQTGLEDTLISAKPYVWEVPSYPLIMMITGGNNGYCESGQTGYDSNQHAFCLTTASDSPAAYLGFRAADAIPSFLDVFLSSSVLGSDDAWLFFNGGLLYNFLNFPTFAVRCVSSGW